MAKQSKTETTVAVQPLYTAAMRFQDITGLKSPRTDEEIRDNVPATPLFYEIGDDVSHLPQDRLDAAVEKGIVTYNEPAAETPAAEEEAPAA